MSFFFLKKGHGIVAATASIPSRYQTIVTDNADKKGFLSQAKRFRFDAGLVRYIKKICMLLCQITSGALCFFD